SGPVCDSGGDGSPMVLQRLHESLKAACSSAWAARKDGLSRVLTHPEVAALHLSFLRSVEGTPDPIEQNYLEGLKLKAFHEGAKALTQGEKRRLLLDPAFIRGLLNKPADSTPPVPEMTTR